MPFGWIQLGQGTVFTNASRLTFYTSQDELSEQWTCLRRPIRIRVVTLPRACLGKRTVRVRP